jgi:hypothetical protein
MAMKKPSGGDFPSPAGCREELQDHPDLRVNGGGGSRCVLEI